MLPAAPDATSPGIVAAGRRVSVCGPSPQPSPVHGDGRGASLAARSSRARGGPGSGSARPGDWQTLKWSCLHPRDRANFSSVASFRTRLRPSRADTEHRELRRLGEVPHVTNDPRMAPSAIESVVRPSTAPAIASTGRSPDARAGSAHLSEVTREGKEHRASRARRAGLLRRDEVGCVASFGAVLAFEAPAVCHARRRAAPLGSATSRFDAALPADQGKRAGKGSSEIRSSFRARRDSGSVVRGSPAGTVVSAWEADTLPTELLPLGRLSSLRTVTRPVNS